MKNYVFGLILFGLVQPVFTQISDPEELSEVTVYATNYKYLNEVKSEEVASVPVKELEKMVANFDVKNSEFYQDEYDEYIISFYIPEGKILAAYSKDGELLRTAERFKNVDLPNNVKNSIAKRFPGWNITKDIYLVTYFEKSGASKRYKVKLENMDKTIRVKLNEDGDFL